MGLISFYSPGSAGQLLVGILWSTIFVFVCNWCQPNTTNFANALKAAMDAAVLVTMVLSLTLKCDLDQPGEDMAPAGIGALMILVNICIPGGVLAGRAVKLSQSSFCKRSLWVGEDDIDAGIDDIYDLLDTDQSGSLDWKQVANFVASTSANSAIGAHALDSDEVKNSMHALDTDGNGTVKTWATTLQAKFGSSGRPDYVLFVAMFPAF